MAALATLLAIRDAVPDYCPLADEWIGAPAIKRSKRVVWTEDGGAVSELCEPRCPDARNQPGRALWWPARGGAAPRAEPPQPRTHCM